MEGRKGRGKGKEVQTQNTPSNICIVQREESEMLELYVHPKLSSGLTKGLSKSGCLLLSLTT